MNEIMLLDPPREDVAAQPGDTFGVRVTRLSLEARLLLVCVGSSLAGDAQGQNVRDLLITGKPDWDRLIEMARSHGVVPLVYRMLKEQSEEDVPAGVKTRLQRDFHKIAMMVKLQSNVLIRVFKALEEKRVDVFFMKGLTLGQLIYGNPIWRKHGDLDILIRPEDYQAVRQVLVGLGLRPALDGRDEDEELAWKKQLTFHGDTCDVDVHCSLQQVSHLKIPYSHSFDAEPIWERGSSVSLAGVDIPGLSAEDLLFFLCVHGAKHCWSLLYVIADIAGFIENVNFDWDKVIALTRRMRAERYVYMGLFLAHRLLGATLPDEIHRSIQKDRKLYRLSHSIVRRLFDNSGKPTPFRFHLLQVSLLQQWAEKVSYTFNVCHEHMRRKRSDMQ